MPIFEAPAVRVQSGLITLSTYFISHAYLKPLLDSYTSSASFIPLQPNTALFVRRDNDKKQILVHVFDQDGTEVYTIERESSLNPVWSLFTFPQRHEVATIRAGFFLEAIDFHDKSAALQHRQINSESGWTQGRTKTFYLDDGFKYGWTRGTKFLEKYVNPGGGTEEVRERVAQVKLMRQWKFDFELTLDDAKVDAVSALSTAFICMMSFWGVGDITETVGPTVLKRKETDEVPELVGAPVELTSSVEPAKPAELSKPADPLPAITLVVDPSQDADLVIEKA